MRTYPCVLTIAGSDCSGGAGIQADIKAISALGAYAASAITAITVQNTLGVTGIHPVPPAYVKGQIEAVMDDIRPKAVKIGMINDAEIVRVIAESILKYHPEYVVFDPVMVSTSGCKLMEDEAIEAITTRLIPLASLITPNLSEAEILAGQKISTVEDMKQQAKEMLKLGCKVSAHQGRTPGRRTDVRCAANGYGRSPALVYSPESKQPEYTRHRMYLVFCHRHVSGIGRTHVCSCKESQTICIQRY